MDLKKIYESYQKKYKLPDYDKLDHEFELLYVNNIIEIKYPLRFIRRRIIDKIGYFIGILQGILQPNPASIISLEESKFFSEEEKKNISLLINRLMLLQRESTVLDTDFNIDEDAKLIRESYKFWLDTKKDILKIIETFVQNWKKEAKEESKKEYIG